MRGCEHRSACIFEVRWRPPSRVFKQPATFAIKTTNRLSLTIGSVLSISSTKTRRTNNKTFRSRHFHSCTFHGRSAERFRRHDWHPRAETTPKRASPLDFGGNRANENDRDSISARRVETRYGAVFPRGSPVQPFDRARNDPTSRCPGFYGRIKAHNPSVSRDDRR